MRYYCSSNIHLRLDIWKQQKSSVGPRREIVCFLPTTTIERKLLVSRHQYWLELNFSCSINLEVRKTRTVMGRKRIDEDGAMAKWGLHLKHFAARTRPCSNEYQNLFRRGIVIKTSQLSNTHRMNCKESKKLILQSSWMNLMIRTVLSHASQPNAANYCFD